MDNLGDWSSVKIKATTDSEWRDVRDALEDYPGLTVGRDNLDQLCVVDVTGWPICYTPAEALRLLLAGNWERYA